MTGTRDLPIGVFDSGVGGLTVMRAIVDRLPDESIVYLGDTARVPYGNRAAATVRRYALNATELLLERGIKALVVACNTASASALETLVERYEVPVIGVIEPVARRAARRTTTGSIGVLGTRGTVRSKCYPQALRRHRPACDVDQVPAPLLVPLAEEGWLEGEVVDRVARHYTESFEGEAIDTIILGCTHYPILHSVLQRSADDVFARDVALLDSASATAAALDARLEERRIRSQSPDEDSHSLDFLFTDVSEAFAEATERFFGERPDTLRHVDITD